MVIHTDSIVASHGIYHLEVPQEILPLGLVCGCRGGKTRSLPIVASQLGLVMNACCQHHTGKAQGEVTSNGSLEFQLFYIFNK